MAFQAILDFIIESSTEESQKSVNELVIHQIAISDEHCNTSKTALHNLVRDGATYLQNNVNLDLAVKFFKVRYKFYLLINDFLKCYIQDADSLAELNERQLHVDDVALEYLEQANDFNDESYRLVGCVIKDQHNMLKALIVCRKNRILN